MRSRLVHDLAAIVGEVVRHSAKPFLALQRLVEIGLAGMGQVRQRFSVAGLMTPRPCGRAVLPLASM